MNDTAKWKRLDAEKHLQVQAWLEQSSRRWGIEFGNLLPSRSIFRAGVPDHWRFSQDTAEWVARTLSGHQLRLYVTDGKVANAWAFRDDPALGEHAIVVTSACYKRMQSIAELVALTALRTRPQPASESTLSRLLNLQAIDARTAGALAQVLTTSATLFLVMHETAHIIRGHRYAAAACHTALDDEQSGGVTGVAIPATEGQGINLRTDNVVKKTKEFDADIQAYSWTQVYFEHTNPNALGALGQGSERVFRALLLDSDGRRFVSLLGAMCFHLALSSSASKLMPLEVGSHPSLQERMQLTYLSDYALAIHQGKERSWLPEVIRFASAMVLIDSEASTSLLFPEAVKEISRWAGESEDARLGAASRWLGFAPEDDQMDELRDRRLKLMEVMKLMAPKLEKHCIPTLLPIMPWWVTAK